jgi:hypothetical protein
MKVKYESAISKTTTMTSSSSFAAMLRRNPLLEEDDFINPPPVKLNLAWVKKEDELKRPRGKGRKDGKKIPIWFCPFVGCTRQYMATSTPTIQKHYVECTCRPDDWKEPKNRCTTPGYRVPIDKANEFAAMLARTPNYVDRPEVRWGKRAKLAALKPRRRKNYHNPEQRWLCPFGCGYHAHMANTNKKKTHVNECLYRPSNCPFPLGHAPGYYLDRAEIPQFQVMLDECKSMGRPFPEPRLYRTDRQPAVKSEPDPEWWVCFGV